MRCTSSGRSTLCVGKGATKPLQGFKFGQCNGRPASASCIVSNVAIHNIVGSRQDLFDPRVKHKSLAKNKTIQSITHHCLAHHLAVGSHANDRAGANTCFLSALSWSCCSYLDKVDSSLVLFQQKQSSAHCHKHNQSQHPWQWSKQIFLQNRFIGGMGRSIVMRHEVIVFFLGQYALCFLLSRNRCEWVPASWQHDAIHAVAKASACSFYGFWTCWPGCKKSESTQSSTWNVWCFPEAASASCVVCIG